MTYKIGSFLTKLFAILLTLGLIAGFLIFILFVFGFIIGGETAAKLCTYIATEILPYEYALAEIIAIIGMIKMYLCKEKTFVMELNLSKKAPNKETRNDK